MKPDSSNFGQNSDNHISKEVNMRGLGCKKKNPAEAQGRQRAAPTPKDLLTHAKTQLPTVLEHANKEDEQPFAAH